MGRRAVTSKRTFLTGITIAATGLVTVGQSYAEEGFEAFLTVAPRFESVSESGFDNPQDDGERAIMQLNFGLLTRNKSQSLGLQVGTGLAYNFSDRDEDTIKDPSIRLNYSLENTPSLLTFSTSYFETDVDNSNFREELEDEDVQVDEGDRAVFSTRIGLALWRDAPVSLTLNHRYTRSDYSDTTDPDLVDSTTKALNAEATFRLNPVAQASAFANYLDVDEAEGGTDRTVVTVGAGLDYTVSPVLRLFGDFTYRRNESSSEGGRQNDGPGLVLGGTLDRPNGFVDASFRSTETINGTRRQLRLGRDLDLPRGNLFASLGVSKTDGLSLEPVANLRMLFEVSDTDRINVNLSQSVTVNNNDEETLRTRLAASYSRSINSVSSISVGVRFADQNALAESGTDQSTLSANLTYNHAITQDWDLVSGYRYSSSARDDREDRTTNTVFIGLSRTLNFRP